MPFALRVTSAERHRLLGCLIWALWLGVADAGNPPPRVELTEAERMRVLAGKPVFFQTHEDPRRAGIAFRVAGDQACVWSVLGDLAGYARRVPSLEESSVYRENDNAVCVRFLASNWLAGSFLYHSCHRFPWPRETWGTFQLDPDKNNAFVSASGFWRTETLPGERSSLVYYVADITPKGGVAGLFRRQFVRSGLKAATQWLPEAIASGELPACATTQDD